MRRPHRILMLAFPVAQSLDVTGPMEVFAQANAQALARGEAAPYSLELAAPRQGPVETSCGVPLLAGRALGQVRRAPGTLILAGGAGARQAVENPALLARIRQLAKRSARVASVCTGAFPLAATGLLDGRRAATHWSYAAGLAARFPSVTVDADAIFVGDGKFHTSAGITAGIDLALALVEQDLGRRAALAVARVLVVFLRRPGGQSQFSGHLIAEATAQRDERFAALDRWLLEHLDEDLSVERLAARMAMSPRTFARRFRAAVGATPAAHVQRLRLDLARRLLSEGAAPVGEVARRAGFGSLEGMRLAFQRHLKVAPQQFRARFNRPVPLAA